MSSKTYDIGLGHNDIITRKKADSDFILFWDDQAKNLSWFKIWDKTLEWHPPFAKWFVGGTINASYNTLDVNLKKRAKKTAILWEGENGDRRTLTYEELWLEVNKFANVLKS
ncbi:MAG: acetyl-coenzyme A synthetase N-terminal domain-containing protein, partial [Nitrosopumilaceae archaeon]